MQLDARERRGVRSYVCKGKPGERERQRKKYVAELWTWKLASFEAGHRRGGSGSLDDRGETLTCLVGCARGMANFERTRV